MIDRAIPQSGEFEVFVRDKVHDALRDDGLEVLSVERGDDPKRFTFDWLFRTTSGCIGLEVTRAEDTDQLDHVEQCVVDGDLVIVGSSIVAWEAVEVAVTKKLAKLSSYRMQAESLNCSQFEMHLGLTSLMQDISASALREQVLLAIAPALGPFDAVWLVSGGAPEAIRA